MISARVHVTLKASVLDPQGSAVSRSLRTLGFEGVDDVRVGKLIELTLDTTDTRVAEAQVREMCERLLANPVIERYDIQLGAA